MTEREIVEGIQQTGDQVAHDLAKQALAIGVHGRFYKRFKRCYPHDAEDLVHELFIAALRGLRARDLDQADTLWTWVASIAKRLPAKHGLAVSYEQEAA